jgi:hypothetical protein
VAAGAEVEMRLSEWRSKAPSKDAGGAKVAAMVDPVIEALGAEGDPHCWVAWGEDPAFRYTIFIPTEDGLIVSVVRVNVPGEGPRATTKLIRWNRVAIGELTVESQAGHRLLSFQLEQQVLRGTDAAADRVAAFALRVLATLEGRAIPPEVGRSRRSSARGAKSTSVKSGARTAAKTGVRPAAKTDGTRSPAAKTDGTRSTVAKTPAARPASSKAATTRSAAVPARPARPARGSGR